MRVGIDIVDVKRIKRLISDERFLKRVFSESEIRYCRSFKRSEERFAARFAAKEAFVKCFDDKKPPLNMIEVINSKNGAPSIYLNGKIVKNCWVSLAHVKDYAVAVCILK